MFGRRRLTTTVAQITSGNILDVLNAALPSQQKNALEIDYLWKYYKGDQPVLGRTKEIRPEINNKVVENHAQEIVDFFSGYFLGEPIMYVRRGEADSMEEINALNEYLAMQSKSALDKELATWMYVGGVGYRMCLPAGGVVSFDVLDPRSTFVIYYAGFGRKPLLCGQIITDANGKQRIAGYTESHYFEVSLSGSDAVAVLRYDKHTMNAIPIIEYDANLALMGAFEPVLSMLDAINTVESNRIDGVEQFIQSIMVLYNADVDDDAVKKMRQWGLVKLKSTDSLKADLKILSEQLDQIQTQTLVDSMMERVKEIVGMPNNAKGLGGGSSGNVGSVIMWQGWEICEARVRDTELIFKAAERKFLRIMLDFLRKKNIVNLSENSIDIKTPRRQYDAAITKVQALQGLLQAGIAPEIAIATCGLFNDPIDVKSRSEAYLKKWEVREDDPQPNPGSDRGSGEAAGRGGDSGSEEGRT